MRYEGMVYRPPSEAFSLIIQATVGCSHNRCTFCSMYKDDSFKIKPVLDIKEDLAEARAYYANVRRIFLADGDALAMKQEDLVEICSYIKEIYPECERIGIYGSPNSILRKTVEELKELKELGIGIIYLGVESGSPKILESIKKGVSREEMVKAGKTVKASGIKLSITLISGLGGRELTREHALESASIVNEMEPDYVGLLTLIINPGTELHDDVEAGRFELLDPKDVLKETRLMVENIEADGCVFRSNHASNYVNLAGTFMRDKKQILEQIDLGLSAANFEEKEKYRRL